MQPILQVTINPEVQPVWTSIHFENTFIEEMHWKQLQLGLQAFALLSY